jgi:hypothetical protein
VLGEVRVVVADGDRDAVTAASGYLAELLTRPGRYQARWRRYLVREDGMQAAITAVIAKYLADYGEPEDLEAPRQLRSRVSRALARNSMPILSRKTLKWFIDAFEFSSEDAARLQALRDGSSHIQFLRRNRGGLELPLLEEAPPRRYRTISLREYHYLGPDGLPSEHHTDQVIEATEDGLDRLLYIADTGALTLDVESGGEPAAMYKVRGNDGNVYHVIDIMLGDSLPRGATVPLRYVTTFHYREAPEPEVRRIFRTRIDSLLMWVQFDPDRLPRAVYWAEWAGGAYEGDVVHRELMELDGEHKTHRFVRGGVENCIVGFFWEW